MRKTTTMRRSVLAALTAFLGFGAAPATALDNRFTDANGDMVADAPTDPKQWVDPSTLIFAYTPVEDPEVYRKVWDEFLAHMSKVTGKRVVFFPVQSNAAQIEAMRAGRLQPDRGELRRVRAVRDDGEQEQRVRL